MRYDRLNILLDRVSAEQEEYVYFMLLKDGTVVRQQDGVFRTNCIDCLDRTNVLQSLLARRNLQQVFSVTLLDKCSYEWSNIFLKIETWNSKWRSTCWRSTRVRKFVQKHMGRSCGCNFYSVFWDRRFENRLHPFRQEDKKRATPGRSQLACSLLQKQFCWRIPTGDQFLIENSTTNVY